MYHWILKYLSLKIEWKWRRILRNRRRMASLVQKGEPYTSRHLVKLDTTTSKLGFEARDMEELYRIVQKRVP